MLGEKSKLPFIIIGVGVVGLIVLFFVLNPRPPQNKFPDIRPLENRLAMVEERLNKLEVLRDQIKNIEDQVRINAETQMIQQDVVDKVKFNSDALAVIEKKLGSIETSAKKIVKTPVAETSRPEEAPPKVAEAQKTDQTGKFYHTVQKGDTAYGISKKYGITVKQLQEMNNIDIKIFPGQKLIVGPVSKQ